MDHSKLKIYLENLLQEIISEANFNSSGVVWETIQSTEGPGVIEKSMSYNLCHGGAGISLFLLEYYKVFPNDEIAFLIKKSLDSCYQHFINPDTEIGFYNGRGGLLYVLAEAAIIFQDEKFWKMCKDLILLPLPVSQNLTYNLFSGVSGLVLGLLNVYVSVKDPLYLSRIIDLVKVLLAGAKICKDGLYWDELHFSSRPLCSFLYGNSGITFLLNELKALFDTSAFDQIIQESIAYEDTFFDQGNSNWIDFYNENQFSRINDTNIKKLISSNKEFPIEPTFTQSWFMGAPGILLSRKSDLCQNTNYAESLKKSIEYLERHLGNTSGNYTLHNGLGGVLLSLTTIDPVNSKYKKAYFDGVVKQYDKFSFLLNSYPFNSQNADLSLLYGECGIAYLLLKMFSGQELSGNALFPSVSPKISYLEVPDFSHSLQFISVYPLKSILPEIDDLKKIEKVQKNSFYNVVMDELSNNENDLNSSHEEVLRFEKFLLQQNAHNYCIQYLKSVYYFYETTSNLDKVKLNSNCKIVSIGEQKVLLHKKFGHIQEIYLSSFEDLFYSFIEFKGNTRKKDLIQFVFDSFDTVNEEDKVFLRNEVTKQIHASVQEGILSGV